MMTTANGGGEAPSTILLATDGSPGAALAARKAVAISAGTGAELHVAHVWHEIPAAHYERFIERELKRKGREVLEAAARHVEEIGGRVAGTHLMEGRTVEGILSVREKVGADVIVAGSRGLGAASRWNSPGAPLPGARRPRRGRILPRTGKSRGFRREREVKGRSLIGKIEKAREILRDSGFREG